MGPFRRGMILLGIICIVIISVSAAGAPDSTPNQAATTGTGIDVINKVWVGIDPANEAKSGETYIQTISDVQADTTVGVSCKKDFYTITPSAGPHGTIKPSHRVVVRRGSSKTFLISPDTGYIIKDVLVDGKSVGPVTSYTFSEVQDDHRISATFEKAFLTIIPDTGHHGTISPSSPVTVPRGGSQTFTITPDPGYAIKDVLVDRSSVGPVPSYTFSDVQDDHRIKATFEKAFFTITPSAGHHGQISPSAPVTVPRGGSQVFTITSDPGYRIKDVVVDGKSVGPVQSYTFTNVHDDHTIKATFKQTKLTFTITPTAGLHGTITPSEPVTVPYAGSQTFTITPASGYVVDQVLVNDETVGSITSYTFTDVQADQTISATFKPGTINCFGDRIDNGYNPTYTIYTPFGDPNLPLVDRDAHVWQWNSQRCGYAFAEVSPDYAHPGTANNGTKVVCKDANGGNWGYGYTQIMQGGAYASPVWGVNLPPGTTISFWYKTIMTGSSASYDGAQVEFYYPSETTPIGTVVPLAETTDWEFAKLSAPAGGQTLEVIFSVMAGNGQTSELWLSNIYAECSSTPISSSASISSVQSRMVRSTSEVSPLSWTNMTGTEQAPGTNTG